jgi:acyl-CoA thioesterase II
VTATLADMLAIFDVQPAPDGPNGRYVGVSDAGSRDVIDGSQLLAQAIVAATKATATGPGNGGGRVAKTARSAHAVFCRAVRAALPIAFDVDLIHDGRTFATAVVTASQDDDRPGAGDRRICATITVLLDTPAADVIRHPTVLADSSPDDAIPLRMPLPGRQIRLVGVVDPNDPDEVGPPRLEAWLLYDEVPVRSELARALLAHFTGHLSISTTMRAHPGIGTSMAHLELSTAVLAISITFHDPVEWDGWILYDHESTAVGAGMGYVRGQIRDRSGRLLASFTQDGMIKAFEGDASTNQMPDRARL